MRDDGNPETTGSHASGGQSAVCLAVAVLLLWLLAPVAGASPTLYLAESDNSSLNQLVRTRLKDALNDQATLERYNGNLPDDALVIALGSSTLKEVRANHPGNPALALFVSSADLISDDHAAPLSAIFSDPPLVRQARLGRLIIPRATSVALLSSPDRADTYDALVTSLKAEGLEARVFVVSSENALVRTLSRALNFGDFLLGTPDDPIYNRNTIKHLLLTSYRQNRMLIGPGRAFVRAGSVASTYTPVPDQVDDGVLLIRHYLESGELPEPRYPSTFSVEVNRQVARSLNLPVPGTDSLKQSLLEMEGRQND